VSDLEIRHADGDGGRHVLLLSGELDLIGAEPLDRELRRLEARDAAGIEVDLRGLSFVDSTGVDLLLSARERARAAGRELSLRRGTARVQRVFELTRTAAALPFVD
jgi:anti-sigma B factor antagonist